MQKNMQKNMSWNQKKDTLDELAWEGKCVKLKYQKATSAYDKLKEVR
jgi:hypothetical protein